MIRDWTPKIAKALNVIGLINIQYAVQDNQVRPYCSNTPPWPPACILSRQGAATGAVCRALACSAWLGGSEATSQH